MTKIGKTLSSVKELQVPKDRRDLAKEVELAVAKAGKLVDDWRAVFNAERQKKAEPRAETKVEPKAEQKPVLKPAVAEPLPEKSEKLAEAKTGDPRREKMAETFMQVFLTPIPDAPLPYDDLDF